MILEICFLFLSLPELARAREEVCLMNEMTEDDKQ